MGVLTGMVRNETERRGQLEALVKNERDRLLGMLEIIGEGVLLIDPEYRIRFMNRSMARKLGEGIGSLCSSICTTLINHVAKSAGLQR